MSSVSYLVFLAGVFASTNIDDLFILVGFFSHKGVSHPQIILGQFLGIGLLVGAGLAVALAAIAISSAYVGLLGIAPILLGLMKLRSAFIHLSKKDDPPSEPSKKGLGAFVVASVTIASGGDNIGIYAPLFATQNRLQMIQTVAVFGVLTLVWCLIARMLVTHPAVAEPIHRIGPLVMPVVLIALGAFILYSSGAFELVTGSPR